jgi:hypothetical protein
VKALGTVLLAGGVLILGLAAVYVVALIVTISLGAIFQLAGDDGSTARAWILTGLTYLVWAVVTAFASRRLWRWLRTP